MIYARNKIRNKIRIEFLKKWLKLSWLTYYPQLANLISKFDVLIYTLIVGSVTGLAYYTAAITISSLVAQSGTISKALYPKLLEGDGRQYLQENLIRVFYFIIPLTALSIAFARPALFALNPLYEVAAIVAIFMIIRIFFTTLTGVFYPALTAIEKVDIDEKATFRDYLKSKLFSLPTISIIQASIYLISLSIVLLFLVSSRLEQINLVIYWSIIMAVTEFPLTIYLYTLVRKNFVLKIGHEILLKYSLTSIGVFGTMYFLSTQFLEFKKSIFEFLPNLVLSGMLCYFMITYLIDNRTQELFKAVIKELRKRN